MTVHLTPILCTVAPARRAGFLNDFSGGLTPPKHRKLNGWVRPLSGSGGRVEARVVRWPPLATTGEGWVGASG